MNHDDHQAKAQQFILKLNGHNEAIMQTIDATDTPPIGAMKISS